MQVYWRVQAQLAARDSALAAARAEVGKLQAVLGAAQREAGARAHEVGDMQQRLEATGRELAERCVEVAQLRAAVAELRQQVQAHEQQKATATPRCAGCPGRRAPCQLQPFLYFHAPLLAHIASCHIAVACSLTLSFFC